MEMFLPTRQNTRQTLVTSSYFSARLFCDVVGRRLAARGRLTCISYYLTSCRFAFDAGVKDSEQNQAPTFIEYV